VSAPQYEVFAYDVPLVDSWTTQYAEEEVEAGSPQEVTVAVLDIDSSADAALLFLQWFDSQEATLSLCAFPEVWVPLPGQYHPDEYMKAHPGAPTVRILIAPLDKPDGPSPTPALSFRVPIMDFGSFMVRACESKFIGITSLPREPEDPDAEEEPLPVIAAAIDGAELAWVELQAWRHSLSVSSPKAYQNPFPLP
jgi:hypothetical protein